MKELDKYLLKASFVGTFAGTMLLPVWAMLTNRVGGDIVDAGIGYALFYIVTGLVVALVGRTKWYSDNVKYMVFVGFLISGVGEFCYIFATNQYELFAIQSLVGLSVGLLNPAWDTLYSDTNGSAAKKWSFWTGGISFIMGISAIVGGLIINYLGWNALFITMGIIDGIAIYYSWKVIKYA